MPTTPPAAPTRPLWQRLLLRRLKFVAVLALLIVLVLGGSYLFAPQWLLKADTARRALTARVDKHAIDAGDTHWSYYEGGQGPTIVLLHGFAASKEIWLEQAQRLTAHFHVVIPDLPGWGESSRIAGASYDIDAQVARLDVFVNALHLPRMLLVGHSMGGAIAGVYAAEHPEHVRELAVLDSFGLTMKENAFAREALAGRNPFDYEDRAGFKRATAWAFLHPPEIPGRIVDVFVARNRRDRAFLDSTFHALTAPSQYLSLQQRLDRLTMPVLGLWCQDDRIIDVSALDNLRTGLVHAPDINTSVLHGCNHMPIVEKPEETARILTGFALSH